MLNIVIRPRAILKNIEVTRQTAKVIDDMIWVHDDVTRSGTEVAVMTFLAEPESVCDEPLLPPATRTYDAVAEQIICFSSVLLFYMITTTIIISGLILMMTIIIPN